MRNYGKEYKGFTSYKPQQKIMKTQEEMKNIRSKKGVLRHHLLDKKISLSELKNWVDSFSLDTIENISFNEQKYLIKIGEQIYDARQLLERLQYDFDTMTESKIGSGFGVAPTTVPYNNVQFQNIIRRSKGLLPKPAHKRNDFSNKTLEDKIKIARNMIYARTNKDNKILNFIFESFMRYGVPIQYYHDVNKYETGQITEDLYLSRMLKIYDNDIKRIDKIYSNWYKKGIPTNLKSYANAYDSGELPTWQWYQTVLQYSSQ